MPAIKGLLFDKDGTLFDFHRTWGRWVRDLIDELASADSDRRDRLAEIMGFDLELGKFRPDSIVIAYTTEEIRDFILPALPDWPADRLFDRMNRLAIDNDMIEAVPLLPLFTAFRDMGLQLGLATNDGEVAARAHLAQAGIADRFDFVAGFDSGWGGKPAAGQMHAFLEATGLEPGQVAMVGDSKHDLDAGRAAGMHAVAVLTGIADAAELSPHADVVLADIAALPGWIATV